MKQARSRRTHELVLDAAAAEFAQHGYPRVNLQHVAERIGLTKGALYGHFSSKEQLARTLTEQLDGLVERLAAEALGAEAPVGERLRTLLGALAERIEAEVRVNAALRLAIEEANSRLEPPGFLTNLRRAVEQALLAARQAGAPGAQPPAGPLADLVVVVLIGAYCTASGVERSGLAARVREIWDALWPTAVQAESC